MATRSTVFALSPAIRTEKECGQDLMPTRGAFGGRQSFKQDNTLNFVQTRHSQPQFFQRVLLHAPHPGGSRGVSEEIWFEAPTEDRANGLVDLKKFKYADASLVPGAVTKIAPSRRSDFIRYCCGPGFGQARGVFGRDAFVGVARAELSHQPLRQNAGHRGCNQIVRYSEIQHADD